jgi:hypothetical protein
MATETKPPSERLSKAGDHFRELAKRMDALMADVVRLEELESEKILELEGEIEELREDARLVEDAEATHDFLLADLNDVRLGIRDLDEIMEKWEIKP